MYIYILEDISVCRYRDMKKYISIQIEKYTETLISKYTDISIETHTYTQTFEYIDIWIYKDKDTQGLRYMEIENRSWGRPDRVGEGRMGKKGEST
jgi:hypothetical protein